MTQIVVRAGPAGRGHKLGYVEVEGQVAPGHQVRQGADDLEAVPREPGCRKRDLVAFVGKSAGKREQPGNLIGCYVFGEERDPLSGRVRNG